VTDGSGFAQITATANGSSVPWRRVTVDGSRAAGDQPSNFAQLPAHLFVFGEPRSTPV
jgi:hypothetical protein